MRIAVCEDNASEQERLTAAIKDWADARKIGADVFCYSSAEAFMFAWPDISFDLVFLDIQMKKMTGIELAEYIRRTDKTMLIVFVTSFAQYSLKGYDVDALHFLVKPLSATKLIPILDKAHVIWRSREKDALLVSDGGGQVRLPFGDIYYISMVSHTAEIHTDGKVYELRKTAAELNILLPSHFMRCHRSYIVNLLKADCVYKDSVLLSNGKKLPISRNSTKLINDAFMRLYME
jgi:DNA-binding LytR/AlgR family response regulator